MSSPRMAADGPAGDLREARAGEGRPLPPNGWFYRVGRAFLDQTIRLYYRRIELISGERIPDHGPAIIVANHPNSVADAFLLASQLTSRKLNFIAKDEITRRPVVGWVVRQFGAVGVARAMDYERQRDLAFRRNKEAVGACVPRLLAGELVAIFGEGISTDARRLHMIRKGAMRFGYAAEQEANFRLGLLWIPVGITYSAKERFRSDVLIRVGTPFRLCDLHQDPGAQKQVVLQLGTERLQRHLEALIVNIEREELAGLIDRLAALIESPAASLAARVERHQHVARTVQYFNATEPQRLAEWDQALRSYDRQLAVSGLTDDVVLQRHPALTLRVNLLQMMKSAAFVALNLYGWANGLAPRCSARLFRLVWRRSAAAQTGAGGPGDGESVSLAKEAWYGTLGGWIGAALAFPLQTYLVYRWTSGSLGFERGIAVSVAYGLSLIPSWRLYVYSRDLLRQRYTKTRDALKFLFHAAPATRLRRRRQRLQQRLRALLAAYDSQGPPEI